MSTTPAKETERNREEIGGRDHIRITTATPVTARKSAASLGEMRGRAKASTNHYPRKIQRRQTCATVINIVRTAQPSVARSVRESLVSYGTTRGEPHSVRRGALTASGPVERTTADFCLVFRPLSGDRGEHRAAFSGPDSDNADSKNLHCAARNTVFGFASGGAA